MLAPASCICRIWTISAAKSWPCHLGHANIQLYKGDMLQQTDSFVTEGRKKKKKKEEEGEERGWVLQTKPILVDPKHWAGLPKKEEKKWL